MIQHRHDADMPLTISPVCDDRELLQTLSLIINTLNNTPDDFEVFYDDFDYESMEICMDFLDDLQAFCEEHFTRRFDRVMFLPDLTTCLLEFDYDEPSI